MTDSPTFTAADVRAMLRFIQGHILRDASGHLMVKAEGDGYALVGMLDAFAEQLEQAERIGIGNQPWAPPEMTATAIRAWLARCSLFSSSHPWIWLDAFAQRLEQEEQRVTDKATGISLRMVQAWDEAADQKPTVMDVAIPILVEQAEKLREEGRREVLKEIAPLPVSLDDGRCYFCNALWGIGGDYQHEPNCLWLRAQEAAK